MQRLALIAAGTNRAFPLAPGAYTIGRGAGNDFQIEDPSVSTTHCRIVVDQDSVSISDLGSTNGTFVNGVLVQTAALPQGKTLRLGSVELLLQAGDDPSATPAPPPAVAAPVPVVRVLSRTTAEIATAEPAAAPATGKAGFCRNHYQNLARYECPKCHRHLCDLCVNTRGSQGGGLKFCKVCGVECLPLKITSTQRVVEFFAEAKRAFKYPFAGDGLMLMFGGTLFFGFLDLANYVSRHSFAYAMRATMMRVTIFTFILGTGYLFSYLKNIIACTAHGDQTMPDWPEFMEWKEDIVTPMFQFVAIASVSFGPAILLNFALDYWFDGEFGWLVWPVLVAGCLVFPMAFLGVAIYDNLAVVNPLFLLGSILRVPKEYGVAAAVFVGIMLLRWLAEIGLDRLMHFPLAPALVADMLTMWLLMIEARILGLLYLSQKPLLGWNPR